VDEEMITPTFVSQGETSALKQKRGDMAKPHTRSLRGFTLLEATITVSVMLVLAAIALPQVNAAVANYRLRNTAAAISSAVQATRYRAIFQGCPAAISFSKGTHTYQLSSKAANGASCAASFSNVGGAVSFGSSSIQLDKDTTLQFSPGGSVTLIAGNSDMSMNLTYGSRTENIKVSKYGNITVTP
jgi:type II secretory pathway pseudopilin PulG